MSTQYLTEESLSILWDGNDVSGITAYGYWREKIITMPSFPINEWPKGTLYKQSSLYDSNESGWFILVWDICICTWPTSDRWVETLRITLKQMCDFGSRISWCGLEGYFEDPPFLFHPRRMSGGVYVAHSTIEFGLMCSAFIGEPFKTLPDGELILLKQLL